MPSDADHDGPKRDRDIGIANDFCEDMKMDQSVPGAIGEDRMPEVRDARQPREILDPGEAREVREAREVHPDVQGQDVLQQGVHAQGGAADDMAFVPSSVGADPDVEAQILSEPLNQPVASAVPSDADHTHPDVQGQDVLQEEVCAQTGAAHMAFSESGSSERESSGATLSLSGHPHVMAPAQLVSPQLVEEIPSDDSDDIESDVGYNRQMTVLSRAGHSILTSNQGS